MSGGLQFSVLEGVKDAVNAAIVGQPHQVGHLAVRAITARCANVYRGDGVQFSVRAGVREGYNILKRAPLNAAIHSCRAYISAAQVSTK